MSDENQPLQSSEYGGMSIEELATASTVYREDLLDGQTIVISGAGTGMGRAMAFLAARLGAKVVICGRREEKLKEVKDGIKQHVGRDIEYALVNIRDPENVESFITDIFNRHGTIHALINSAGGQFSQAAIDFSRKGWLAVIDTNLNGTWWMMQEAAKKWRDTRQEGNIINIAAYVERGMPQSAHSCAARAGVIYLSKTVSTEWAEHNIRVNCIAPGLIRTDFARALWENPETLKRSLAYTPMQRIGEPEEIAGAAVFLASKAGSYMNGQMMVIDGGQTIT